MPLDTIDTTLESVHALTPNVKQFLIRAEGHIFDFVPGQHVSVEFEDADGNARYRPYSPVSQPGTDTLSLAIKRYPEGACSTWMHDRTVGDSIPVTPPSGNLQLEDPDRDAVFVATGTGLTPLFAMATQHLHVGEGRTTLLFGERTQESVMYGETLDLLSASHEAFSVEYVLSGEDWHGRTGYVQDHLLEIIEDTSTSHFYVCGVPDMVVETKARLSDLEVPAGHVFTEGWEEGAVAE